MLSNQFFTQLNIKAHANSTDESSGESPYFVFFVGHQDQSSSVFTIRNENWDNAWHAGNTRSMNTTPVFTGIGSNDTVIVAMVEEDDGADMTGANLNDFAKDLQAFWKMSFVGTGVGSGFMIEKMMENEIGSHDFGNDDLIGVANLNLDLAHTVATATFDDNPVGGSSYTAIFSLI